MRRFTRLTNAFSKKVENHAAAVAIHFMHYNFARPHKTLANPYPRTPAMAAGIADHVWTPARDHRTLKLRHYLHVASVLPNQPPPARHRLLHRQSVGALAIEQLGRPLDGEPHRGIDAQPLADVLGSKTPPVL